MKTIDSISKIVKNLSLGLVIAGGVIYCLPMIGPSFHTGTKVNGNEISITKRKGLFSTVKYTTNLKNENEIHLYNFNQLNRNYGLIVLTDKNNDNKVDEIYYSEDPLTNSSFELKRDTNDFLFKKADQIYKEQIKRFKE